MQGKGYKCNQECRQPSDETVVHLDALITPLLSEDRQSAGEMLPEAERLSRHRHQVHAGCPPYSRGSVASRGKDRTLQSSWLVCMFLKLPFLIGWHI